MIPTKMQLWYPKQLMDASSRSDTKSRLENKIVGKMKVKHCYERKLSPTFSEKSEDAEMTVVEFLKEDGSGVSSRTNSSDGSDGEVSEIISRQQQDDEYCSKGRNRRYNAQVKRREDLPDVTDFIDFHYWTREVICCGTIYRGRCGETLSDPRFLRPCGAALKSSQHETKEIDNDDSYINTGSSSETSSCNTSDSGEDEYLNRGMSRTENQNSELDGNSI
ncbi:SIN3-HDAC complex-associated factor-like [Coccinella septempunctata]|uniref:SIN3-HDAC complex-associated factor-like n=1 Tax=Coccinella septempunctata TaxID=41139 RepID=UPI001D08F704|nr:SIN3-HDAC complex-associated factor-like [Coccinella septempunctata]